MPYNFPSAFGSAIELTIDHHRRLAREARASQLSTLSPEQVLKGISDCGDMDAQSVEAAIKFPFPLLHYAAGAAGVRYENFDASQVNLSIEKNIVPDLEEDREKLSNFGIDLSHLVKDWMGDDVFTLVRIHNLTDDQLFISQEPAILISITFTANLEIVDSYVCASTAPGDDLHPKALWPVNQKDLPHEVALDILRIIGSRIQTKELPPPLRG